MDRRNFLKQAMAAAAVGAVAPKLLAEEAVVMGVDTSTVAEYIVTSWNPLVILKARSLTTTLNEAAVAYRKLFLDTEVSSGA